MGILIELQAKLKQSGFWLFSAFLFVYFGFHTINGDRGLLKYLYLKKEIAEARLIYEGYHRQKQHLEEKVRLLSSSSLDLDLLDERARVVLNYTAEDEFVILDGSEKKDPGTEL